MEKKVIKIKFSTFIAIIIVSIIIVGGIIAFALCKESKDSNNIIEYKNEKYNLKYVYNYNVDDWREAHELSWDDNFDRGERYMIHVKNEKNGKHYGLTYTSPSYDSNTSLTEYFKYVSDDLEDNIYTISLQKINSEFEVLEESAINNVKFSFLEEPKAIEFKHGVLSWDPVKNADAYNIYFYRVHKGDPGWQEVIGNIKEYKGNKVNISKYVYLKNAEIIQIVPIDTTNKYCSLSYGEYYIE